MKTLHLLPFDHHNVKISFNKDELLNTLKIQPGLPHNSVLEIEIEDDLASKLSNPPSPKAPPVTKIPTKYYTKQLDFMASPPEWYVKEGHRIYIIFDSHQRCFWSPSENNLNSIAKHNPDSYLSDAIRVEIDEDAETNLNVYFEYICDNF